MKLKSHLLAVALLAGVAGTNESQAQTCRGPKPTICERSCWNARAPQCSLTQMSELNRVVIHHTASSSDYSTGGLNDSKGKVRSHQNYHMDVNGWCDIGYHFLVDKHGNIFEGRKDSATIGERPKGAHDGCNDRSFGFTAMGYFHSPYNNTPTTALMNNLEKVIAWRMPVGWGPKGTQAGSYCGKSLDDVISHRDVSATACPGDKLYNEVKEGSGFETAIENRRSCN